MIRWPEDEIGSSSVSALDEPQDQRLPVRERVRVVPHSEQRQEDRGPDGRARDGPDSCTAHGGILRSDTGSRRPEEKLSQFAAIVRAAVLLRRSGPARFSSAGSTERD